MSYKTAIVSPKTRRTLRLLGREREAEEEDTRDREDEFFEERSKRIDREKRKPARLPNGNNETTAATLTKSSKQGRNQFNLPINRS